MADFRDLDELVISAETIRTNTLPSSNTAILVGRHLGMINEILQVAVPILKKFTVDDENIHVHTGLFADDFISAFGKNDEEEGKLPDAPFDGKQYARKDGTWVEVTSSGGGASSWSELNPKPDKTELNSILQLKDWAFKDKLEAADIPGLSWSKITSDKPSTIGGYGITDAKIVNGVITLGTNTITPLTEHQSLDGYATKTWVENKGYLTSHQNLSAYATQSWVEQKGYLTTHQDISGKADKATNLAGYGITDAMSTSHAANEITSALIANWNTTYSNSHNHSNKAVLDKLTQGMIDVLAKLSLVDGKVKVDAGLYSTDFISAFGLSASSSTGGVASVKLNGTTYTPNASGVVDLGSISAGTEFILTKAKVETVLTGNITTHTHSQYLTAHQDISGKADKATTLAGYGITDAMNTSHAAYGVTSALIANWNSAYTYSHSHSNKAVLDKLTQGMIDVLGKLSLVDGKVKVDAGLYSTDFISAYGLNASSSAGGVASVKLNGTTYTPNASGVVDLGSISAGTEFILTKAKVETVLTGNITTHTHSQYLTSHQDISGKANKATTLAGYGITDAKIANGVITLGTNTITPLTSHQSLANYVTTSDSRLTDARNAKDVSAWAKAATKPSYAWSEITYKPTIYPAAECTTYTNDTDLCTPAAVKKAVGLFEPKEHTHSQYITSSGSITGSSGSCTGNAATATKLQTARSLWGNSFDGSAAINGTIKIKKDSESDIFVASRSDDSQPCKIRYSGWGVMSIVGFNSTKISSSNDNYVFIGDEIMFKHASDNPYMRLKYNSTYWYVQCYNSSYMYLGTTSSKSIRIDTSGNLLSVGEITAYSDARLKTDVKDLSFRGRLSPKTYIKDGKESIGFLAQDVQKLYPELVTDGEYLSLNYMNLTAVLSSQINGVEDEVSVLKRRVKELEKEVEQLKMN